MRFIFLAEGAVVLFFTFAQLLAKNKQPIHYCMILACLALSYILGYFWAADAGILERFPALIGSDVAAIFLATPSFYLSALSFLYEGKRPVRRYTVYFIAPVVLAIGTLVYNALAGRTLVDFGAVAPRAVLGHFLSRAKTILALSAILFSAASIVLDLAAALRLRKESTTKPGREFRRQVVFLFCYFVAALIMLSGFVFRDERPLIAGFAIIGFVAVAFALSHMGFSYFSADRPPLPRRARAEWDKSAEELASRLQGVMEKSAPYRDSELTLRSLARLLGVEPARLSYHLNFRHSLTFRGYINDWRLKSVCDDLLKRPDFSILDIAFENGFNSKSSFNALFVKKYGMTPREYRRRRESSPG